MGASLRGVVELNLLFLLAGIAILWGMRGFRSLLDLLDLLGLALALGLGSVSVLATLVLVAGGGLPAAVIVALALAVLVAGSAVALAARRGVPRRLGRLPISPGTCFALAAALGALVVLVGLFRVARVAPLGGGDSWQFWVPKAKLIYFTGGIGDPLFTTLPGPNYPLLVPALFAMDFRFMGSADAAELAVQNWFLYAAFVLAPAPVLRRLVPAWLAWLFVAATAVIPQLDARVLNAQADWTLDILFALTALLGIGWLRTGERWQLWSFGILLSAVFATLREGELLAACLCLGIAAASRRSRRRVWPRLFGVGAAAYALNVPWRIWWTSRGLPSDLPGGGFHLHQLLTHRSLIWPSLMDVLQPLFSATMWLVFVPTALVASAACLTLAGPARDTAVVYLTTFVLAVAGLTWVGWSDPGGLVGSLNPLPRVVGSLVLLSTVLAPLLIDPLLRRSKPLTRSAETATRSEPIPSAPSI